ncbi:MAG TPA: hypothetical protein VFB28_06245 [Terriglobales bacterium]|nr:hypothetical protein [Terriglobales bacterium]
MSNLGLDTVAAPAKKKDLGRTAQVAFVSLLIAFFAWVVISNAYLLVFQKPLIPN